MSHLTNAIAFQMLLVLGRNRRLAISPDISGGRGRPPLYAPRDVLRL